MKGVWGIGCQVRTGTQTCTPTQVCTRMPLSRLDAKPDGPGVGESRVPGSAAGSHTSSSQASLAHGPGPALGTSSGTEAPRLAPRHTEGLPWSLEGQGRPWPAKLPNLAGGCLGAGHMRLPSPSICKEPHPVLSGQLGQSRGQAQPPERLLGGDPQARTSRRQTLAQGHDR